MNRGKRLYVWAMDKVVGVPGFESSDQLWEGRGIHVATTGAHVATNVIDYSGRFAARGNTKDDLAALGSAWASRGKFGDLCCQHCISRDITQIYYKVMVAEDSVTELYRESPNKNRYEEAFIEVFLDGFRNLMRQFGQPETEKEKLFASRARELMRVGVAEHNKRWGISDKSRLLHKSITSVVQQVIDGKLLKVGDSFQLTWEGSTAKFEPCKAK